MHHLMQYIVVLFVILISIIVNVHAHSVRNYVAITDSAPGTPKVTGIKVLQTLFKVLQITNVDPQECVKDITGAGVHFRDFADDLHNKDFKTGIDSLEKGISSLSSSVSGCGVKEVQTKLDALALAIKFAKISKLDDAVKIVVGASDLWTNIEVLAKAAKGGDASGIGNAIGKLLSKWTQVTGGCKKKKGCLMVDGVIRIIQTVAKDLGPCENALSPIVNDMESVAGDFRKEDYSKAIKDLATTLEKTGEALQSDSCGLKNMGELIGKLSPKLGKAIVKVEKSKDVAIIVGTANVYDAIFKAVEAITKGDFRSFGMQIGTLLRQLRASHCSTKACVVVEGIMASVQMESSDFDSCMKDADGSWKYITEAMGYFKGRYPIHGAKLLGQAFVKLADAVEDCNVPKIAKVAEQMLTKLNDNTISNDIGTVVQVLVDGADVTHDMNKAILDFHSENWAGLGGDLHTFATFLSDAKCNSVACKVVEGILNAGGVALKDLKGCEADIKKSINGFSYGAQQFEDKKFGDAVKSWASSLNTIARSVTDCGLENEIKYIEQEANVLGYANASTKIGDDFAILVHGVDFYKELYATVKDIKDHDYRGAGGNLQKVMNQLAQWTEKHACTSDFCYIVVGVFQFLGDMEGSVKTCEADFKNAFGDFKSAWHSFAESHGGIFHWKRNEDDIRKGVKQIGDGMKLVAKGVSDCHLEEFADILSKLAIKLGIVPEVGWIEEILHIVIKGVKIENEIGDACDDFGNKNWVGFGYNVARLVKTLV